MDSRKAFLQAADKIGAGIDCWSHLLADPWPDWFLRIVLRFARVFTPELKAADLKARPGVFLGNFAGMMAQLVKLADRIDLSEIADNSPFAFLKSELPKTISSESTAIEETLAAANRLPSDQYAEFFAAFGSTLENETVLRSIERMEDSPTVQICFFLMFLRPRIDAGQFKSVSQIVELYVKLDTAFGGHQFPTPESKASFAKQFRKICSEAGLRLRGKGRPRKMPLAGRP